MATYFNANGPLHLLAHAAIDFAGSHTDPAICAVTHDKPAGPCYDNHTSSSFVSRRNVTNSNLHISCGKTLSVSPEQRPFKRSSTSNSLQNMKPSSSRARHMKRQTTTRKTSRAEVNKAKMEMNARRKELMERARKIMSIDNSPVNDKQLLVLRMVFDQITMYPSEAWMVLIAIIIRRAFKQVKNWFSNERQKAKGGQVVSAQTDVGENMRLRPMALQLCQEWSDSFFEEVVMVYNFRILRTLESEDI